MREDFANFVRAVSVYWILLMSGAFGLFATIIERATHNQQGRSPIRKFSHSWVFIAAYVGSIFGAFFLTGEWYILQSKSSFLGQFSNSKRASLRAEPTH